MNSKIISHLSVLALGLLLGYFLHPHRPVNVIAVGEPVTAIAPIPEREPSAAILPEIEPKLPPPAFKQSGLIRSSVEGYILVRWNEVPGAEEYAVDVRDEHDQPVRTLTTSHSFIFLRDLKVDPRRRETGYRVQVTARNAALGNGLGSEWKTVAMLPMKNLAPPTIKSISTED